MRYIKSFKIFENVNQAKAILKSLDKDVNDESYLKIRDILKGYDGYVGWFTNLHYKLGYSLNELKELWDLIKLNLAYISKLPKQLITYDNIEKIQDDLEIVKGDSTYNKIVGEFPTKQRRLLMDSDKELLINLAKRKDNISFFKKVSSYHTRKDMIEGIKNFLSVDPNSNLDKVMKIAKENGSDIIYYSYEDDILIVRVYSSSELNRIAGDCSWCIRQEGTFKNYVTKESKQFIIFLFNRVDNLSRIGVTARMTSKNFHHTAHNKRDGYVSYEDLKNVLKEYNVDPNDFMKFNLSDVNPNEIPVDILLNTYNISKNDIIKIKDKYKPEDIVNFTNEEIEKWNLSDKLDLKTLNYTNIKYFSHYIELDTLKEHLKKIDLDNGFKFRNWESLIKLYKEKNKNWDDILDYLFEKIKSNNINWLAEPQKEYWVKVYKNSNIFTDEQIKKLRL
jgi:hypothetical protein